MPEERLVAGLRCGEVLERLSDYVDGDLPPREVERVEGHLKGCDWCEQMGGDFAAAVAAIRRHLVAETAVPEDARRRLRDRLRRS